MKTFFPADDHFENPFFIGTVINNNDPTYNYRVKVKIQGMHDNINDEHLPWAAKVDSSFMGMDSSTSLHAVPEVGSKVLLLAIGNNINSLVYLGCLYKNTTSTPSNGDYLNTYGIFDKEGNFIKLDKLQKLLQLVWNGKININKIQEMTITVNGNVNLTAPLTNIKGNVKIDGTLDVTQDISTDTNVTAKIEVTAAATTLTKHTHPGVFPGPSSTAPGQG